MRNRLVAESTIFVDISPWVKKSPTAGHVFTFHSHLLRQSSGVFRKGAIFGPLEEASKEITPVFRDSYFGRGLGTLFQAVNMSEDLDRAMRALDSLEGTKLLHFYEGGFRELTFLSRILSARDDCVAIFNFFASEPWIPLISKQNPLSKLAIKIMSDMFISSAHLVAFTADTPKFAQYLSGVFHDSDINVYPLFSSLEPRPQTEVDWKARPITYLFTPRTLMEQKLTVRSIELLQDRVQSRIKIAIAARWTANFTEKLLRSLSNKNIEIEVLSGPLSDEQYENLFFQTKVVVLPYLDKHYVYGSSGKTLDARNGGCWVVAPAGIASGELLAERGWGKTFNGTAINLAGVLVDDCFSHPPIFDEHQPSSNKSVEFLVEQLGRLNIGEDALSKLNGIYVLPFLVGVQGLQWLFAHLILHPGRRFTDWVSGFIQRK